LGDPGTDRAFVSADSLGRRRKLAGASAGFTLLAAGSSPVGRQTTVRLKPYSERTQLGRKPGVDSSHQLQASTNCGSALVEELRPAAQLGQRQPCRGHHLRFIAYPAGAWDFRQ
jgi:hypothetical protein